MNDMELAEILRSMYDNAKRNEAVCQVNLFGILYAEELQSSGCTIKHIVESSPVMFLKSAKESSYPDMWFQEAIKNEFAFLFVRGYLRKKQMEKGRK